MLERCGNNCITSLLPQPATCNHSDLLALFWPPWAKHPITGITFGTLRLSLAMLSPLRFCLLQLFEKRYNSYSLNAFVVCCLSATKFCKVRSLRSQGKGKRRAKSKRDREKRAKKSTPRRGLRGNRRASSCSPGSCTHDRFHSNNPD